VRTATRQMGILLADDHAVVRSGLRLLLGAEPDLEVVGEANNGLEAVEQTTRLRPDVVVMDIAMPGMSGLELMDELNSRRISLRTILVTGRNDKTIQERAIALGAVTLLEKPIDLDALMAAIAGKPKA